MVQRPKDELLDHEYDGIREFDNPCPAWWHLIFIGSIVFSVFYWAFFHLGPSAGKNGWTLLDAYEQANAENLNLQFGGVELTLDERTMLELMQGTFAPPADPEAEPADGTPAEPKDWLAMGATIFKTNCKSCHAEDGSGLVGPNLTDDHYKNVKTLLDIATVIENGAANGSMPAWKNRLDTNQVVLVSAYVADMRGKNLTGPKGPEGDVIPPWPTEPTDTSSTDESAGEEAAPDTDEPSGADEPTIAEEGAAAGEAPTTDETATSEEVPAAESAEEPAPSDE
jgi:cytochrome c oxidase cbb3-type subunit 3